MSDFHFLLANGYLVIRFETQAMSDGIESLAKDKIDILFREYDTLRAEIMARSGHNIQMYGICAIVIGWLITQPFNLKLLGGFLFVAIAFFLIFKAMRRDINKAAAKLQELEQRINSLAGEELLTWEQKSGGAKTGYVFNRR